MTTLEIAQSSQEHTDLDAIELTEEQLATVSGGGITVIGYPDATDEYIDLAAMLTCKQS